MESTLEILRILLPLVIVGGIIAFVILRMKHIYNKGTIVKKKSKGDQILLDSLIPFGLLIGLVVAILLSLFSSATLVSTIVWGPAIGLLFGYLAYEIYSKKGKTDS